MLPSLAELAQLLIIDIDANGGYTAMPASSFSLARSGFAGPTGNSTGANYFNLSIHTNSSIAEKEPFRW
jgi:hypothetical protein